MPSLGGEDHKQGCYGCSYGVASSSSRATPGHRQKMLRLTSSAKRIRCRTATGSQWTCLIVAPRLATTLEAHVPARHATVVCRQEKQGPRLTTCTMAMTALRRHGAARRWPHARMPTALETQLLSGIAGTLLTILCLHVKMIKQPPKGRKNSTAWFVRRFLGVIKQPP